jgi:hypothetical protein
LCFAQVSIQGLVFYLKNILLRDPNYEHLPFLQQCLHKLITLFSNYGECAVAFLQKLEQNSLLINVHLCFYFCSEYLLQIMTNFLPLFTSVNSIATENPDVLDKLQSEYSELAIPMLTSAQHLITVLVFTKKLYKNNYIFYINI